MFGRSKRKRKEEEAALAVEAEAGVPGSMPELDEAVPSLKVEEEAPAAALDGSLGAGRSTMPATTGEAIRLFPGFEREDFEVGFSTGTTSPALVMRWKDGGDWFRVPALFNRSVLAAMDERDSAGDLTRLLRSFGYEVE